MKYVRPETLAEAASLFREYAGNARIIAGGTDMNVHWRKGEELPAAVIDISRLPGLKRIALDNGRIFVGAAVTFQEAVDSPLLRRHAPLLSQACSLVGVWQVRNRGTIGGNIANASPVADSVPALIALDATLHLMSAGGGMERLLGGIFIGPGRTDLAPDQIITGVSFIPQGAGEFFFYEKLGQRKAQCIAKVSVACRAVRRDNRLHDARIILGAVGPTVIRATAAEALINGAILDAQRIRDIIWAAADASTPITDLRSEERYRHDMVAALLYRNLKDLQ